MGIFMTAFVLCLFVFSIFAWDRYHEKKEADSSQYLSSKKYYAAAMRQKRKKKKNIDKASSKCMLRLIRPRKKRVQEENSPQPNIDIEESMVLEMRTDNISQRFLPSVQYENAAFPFNDETVLARLNSVLKSPEHYKGQEVYVAGILAGSIVAGTRHRFKITDPTGTATIVAEANPKDLRDAQARGEKCLVFVHGIIGENAIIAKELDFGVIKKQSQVA